MVAYNMEIKNVGPILRDLLTVIKKFNIDEHVYVSRGAAEERSSLPGPGVSLSEFGIKDLPLPGILSILGIRSLTLNSRQGLQALSRLNVNASTVEIEKHKRELFKDSEFIKDLQSLFSDCRAVAFDDWATLTEASVAWDGLLTDVIAPLGKTDQEYIFYLGDAMRKLFFEVDEALDLISAFSLHGKVTVALDENEAVKLWMILNGIPPGTAIAEQSFSDLKSKYFWIFIKMNIANLLIYSANDVILYSNDEQFVLSRRKVDHNLEMAPDARQNFIAGYSLGSLMRLNIGHRIALGLIVFGVRGELKSGEERNNFCDYIQSWVRDLQRPDGIQLYQGD
jgi:hypothetical protein